MREYTVPDTQPTITVGEVRRLLEGMADDRPITILQPDGSWWLNIDRFQDSDEEPSAMFGTRDDFDTRQWPARQHGEEPSMSTFPNEAAERAEMRRLFVERRAEAQQLLDRVFTRVNALDPSIIDWTDVAEMGRIVEALRSVDPS